MINKWSPDISVGVHVNTEDLHVDSRDQGIMLGLSEGSMRRQSCCRIHKQTPDTAGGVYADRGDFDTGAGDQKARNGTEDMMGLTHTHTPCPHDGCTQKASLR